MGFFFERLRRS